MTAASFLQLQNQLVYLFVAVAVIVEAIRRPRRTVFDTVFFFVALAAPARTDSPSPTA
jgi:hypothetical protein